MSIDLVPSDVTLLDLLRRCDSMSVAQLAELLEVTSTAVRQRLNRLMAQGYLKREATKGGRGRPSHRYRLTSQGRRQTGANFGDLAIALWEEIRSIDDIEVRRGLLKRLAKRLASTYADEVHGETLEDKMQVLCGIFEKRDIPMTVDRSSELPVLTALACPYPDLAEKDRSICSVEKMLFGELLGQDLKLTRCRLDEDGPCTFETN
jgi:predicted ArsR family transcriptional regulator